MTKSPPGIQIMDPRLATSGARLCASRACDVCADMNLGCCEGLRYEIERRSRRDQLFLLGRALEIPDDALRVLHHPPADVALVDGLALLRVFLQMRDAGEAERQFRIVEMLLPLEVDLEVLPFDRMQLVLEPDDAGFAVRGRLLAERSE